ncbi:hypothetical protein [Arthrobacter sp. H5]|uniref:hypothetical protein n=1 Tax=Arthrobacter sp. H5 TaxID=1267973 RepID=UPI000488F13B|nr:hypothetical protein [Arthrobacter sp. H5]
MRRRFAAAAVLALLLTGCSESMSARPQNPYFEQRSVDLEAGDVIEAEPSYHGWWSTVAHSRGTGGFPPSAVLYSADSGEFIEGYDRTTGTRFAGTDRLPTGGWPAGSVVVVDPATGVVWDNFRVDSLGAPLPTDGPLVTMSPGFPPIAGDPPPGTLHIFGRNYQTGDIVYLGTSPAADPDFELNMILDW